MGRHLWGWRKVGDELLLGTVGWVERISFCRLADLVVAKSILACLDRFARCLRCLPRLRVLYAYVTGGVVGGSTNATLGGVATLGDGAIGVGLACSWRGTLGSAAGGRGAVAVGIVGGEGEQSAVAWANILA
eukprot:scaffold363691_cov55-Attheya_sp.AAC.2